MPARTIYLKSENVPVFERAKQIAQRENKSLSRIIEEALVAWVEKKEREVK